MALCLGLWRPCHSLPRYFSFTPWRRHGAAMALPVNFTRHVARQGWKSLVFGCFRGAAPYVAAWRGGPAIASRSYRRHHQTFFLWLFDCSFSHTQLCMSVVVLYVCHLSLLCAFRVHVIHRDILLSQRVLFCVVNTKNKLLREIGAKLS